jgi:hypothetical protein
VTEDELLRVLGEAEFCFWEDENGEPCPKCGKLHNVVQRCGVCNRLHDPRRCPEAVRWEKALREHFEEWLLKTYGTSILPTEERQALWEAYVELMGDGAREILMRALNKGPDPSP